MLMNWLTMKLLNPMLDEATVKMLTADYTDNPFLMATVGEKLGPRALIEAGMRAESGKALARPLGSPVVLSPWDKLLLNPKQVFAPTIADYTQVDTRTTIGPLAKRPLSLETPVLITGMSYGGSLSLPLKIALAKGASQAGTATNTGESAMTSEERESAKFLIGQYHRGGWLSGAEQLGQLDAIEIQLGQGAWGGAVDEPISAAEIGEHLREAWRLAPNEDTVIYARLPDKDADLVSLVERLKADYGVPVGIKIAGSDYIEDELAVIARSKPDYLVVDGSEGGTSAANPTLQDHVGLPTLHTLVRTIDWLRQAGIRDRISVIAAGGLTTPGHFLKALAIGADAVYIGTIALMAALQAQVIKTTPQAPPVQMALYNGKFTDRLDIDHAARHLANFLASCKVEMQLAAQAVGRYALRELDRSDLVTVEAELAEFMDIRCAASPRQQRHSRRSQPETSLPLQ
ncbi:MAG: FMN-binding glutamate synthase family protein [Sporomusaceae bacterium]|nr:FMN-binding glutamate synthase family protein [Sporomusaceae bacterium]